MILFAALSMASGCGQKGPLVLPDKHKPTITDPVQPASSADTPGAAPTP
jgi:predicted small lipoprotein YifL